MFSALLSLAFVLLIVITLFAWKQFQLQRQCAKELSCMQETLGIQMDERAALARHLNHSVKNNLQLISSLLNMQLRRMSDDEPPQSAQRTIRDIQGRIETMSMIHKELYRSGDYQCVCAVTLFNDVASHALSRSQATIELSVDVERSFIDYDTALPLGLIVQELVANAVQHGLADTLEPKIVVSFKKISSGWSLRISDNGSGFPPEIDPMEMRTLGLTLVRDLAEQINAEFLCEADRQKGGASFECKLPEVGAAMAKIFATN